MLGSLAAICGSAGPALSEPDASLSERLENRLQFNEYYEKTLRSSRQTALSETSAKSWSAVLTTSVGYDSNAALDIPRVSDHFFQETADFSWSAPHPGLAGDRWAGDYGILAGGDWLSYSDETEADYLSPSAEVFVTFDPCRALTLRQSYRFGYMHYPQDEDLRYYSHEIVSTLTHHATDRLEHEVYLGGELRNYTDRNALNAQNLEKSENRTDLCAEAGYRLRYQISASLEAGASGGVKINRSNDVYEDYSDYHGGQGSAYVYYQITESLAAMLLGGYDYKKYEERHFAGSPRKAERDNYLYFGPSLYWSFAENKQLVLSYLGSKNASNDPSQRYIDQLVTASVVVSF